MTDKRTTRSDAGMMVLTNAILTDILGLTPNTSEKVINQIRSQGEFQNMKQNLRNLSGVAYRRLNDVINLAQTNGDEDSQEEPTNDPNDDEVDLDFATDTYRRDRKEDDVPDDDFDKAPDDSPDDYADHFKQRFQRSESKKPTFLGFLLQELQIDVQDVRTDPETKQDMMRIARANDTQAATIQQRMAREKIQKTRKAIQTEEDPKKANIRRRIMNLEKQLEKARNELTGTDTNNSNQGRM